MAQLKRGTKDIHVSQANLSGNIPFKGMAYNIPYSSIAQIAFNIQATSRDPQKIFGLDIFGTRNKELWILSFYSLAERGDPVLKDIEDIIQAFQFLK